jgi:hypothetical protein
MAHFVARLIFTAVVINSKLLANFGDALPDFRNRLAFRPTPFILGPVTFHRSL